VAGKVSANQGLTPVFNMRISIPSQFALEIYFGME